MEENNFIEYEYDAIAFRQGLESEWTVSFCASADQIINWVGIPQKKNFDNVESSGFQRTIKKERMGSLISFFNDPKNIIQNPLLCATTNKSDTRKIGSFFTPDNENSDSYSQKGKLLIRSKNFNKKSLQELLSLFRETLEKRVPELVNSNIDQELLAKIKEIYYGSDYVEQSSPEDTSPDVALEVEDSHIQDLWQEIKCREIVLSESGRDNPESILGFDKASIISYLLPVTLVDGQHRLMGAIEQYNNFKDSNTGLEIIEKLTSEDLSITDLEKRVSEKYCRKLPISMILSEDPAEHVFQFVVVNQKATPINSALLGTIVSTTLSSKELESVSHRLKNADIPLEDSKAISFATRDPESPFFNLVQTGITGEDYGKLPWTVMKGLVSIFKDLKGAKYYSDTVKTDFSDLWKRRVLEKCDLIPGDNIEEKIENWSSENGLWRDFFISFWSKIRDTFGSTSDVDRKNYWGNTNSNLFNKVSLNILAADYFKYISGSKYEFNENSDVEASINDWLEDVDRSYFDRDWVLKDIKKDSPGIRKQWSHLWMNYREDPRKLPAISQYRNSFSG
ncbi:hypothetical protein DN730_06895 [Marinomonas piezotolerans]|uniref:DGQHR domain-containing protein n=1 Tax=Marinomonas piezotolerans TaxID=2213058 RepID=A0A370UC56_9GAMM|nr:hypothetical protein [Marinomonas piezotolerans]RDL45329.1 hypothetical protein DN730_06895 [Marinomonas piezotolerans]